MRGKWLLLLTIALASIAMLSACEPQEADAELGQTTSAISKRPETSCTMQRFEDHEVVLVFPELVADEKEALRQPAEILIARVLIPVGMREGRKGEHFRLSRFVWKKVPEIRCRTVAA